LQTQGDSRGKLIVTQYQLSLDPYNQILIKNQSKLFQNNEWVEPWWQKQVECHWRLGFIHKAFYDMRGDETAGGWIRRMLQNPSFRFLRRLMIYNISPFGHQQLVRLLSESLPDTVNQLELFGIAKHSISKDAEIRRVPTLKIYSQPSPTSKQKSLW